MSLSKLSIAVVLSSSLALAAADGGKPTRDGGPCVVRPDARYRFRFDAAEVAKVVPVIADMTCKMIVLAPGTETARITIATPESGDFTAEQFFRAFVAAVEVNGLAVTEKDGIVRIAPARR